MKRMKFWIPKLPLVLLGARQSAPFMSYRGSGTPYGLGPAHAEDTRLKDLHYYMNVGDDMPAWTRAAPAPIR